MVLRILDLLAGRSLKCASNVPGLDMFVEEWWSSMYFFPFRLREAKKGTKDELTGCVTN